MTGDFTLLGAAGGPFFIVYNNSLLGTNVPGVIANYTASTATASMATLSEGVGAGVQTLTLGGTATGGTLSVTFEGTTGSLSIAGAPTTVTSANLQTVLNQIPALIGNYSVFGASLGSFTIVFSNALANIDVPQLTATMTGSGNTATTSMLLGRTLPASEIETITLGGTTSSAQTISFGGSSTTLAATAPNALTFTALQAALIPAGSGSVSSSITVSPTTGAGLNRWAVYAHV